MQIRPRHPLRRASALALVCANLAACADPISGPVDFGDGGVGIAAGQVTVHTASTNLPALVASASLTLGSMQAGSDRDPSTFATFIPSAAIGMESDDPTVFAEATPATYGSVRLVAIDKLTVTATTGNALIFDFSNVAPLELRCAGTGTYLDPSSSIDMRINLNFSTLQSLLTGQFPPATTTTVTGTPAIYATLSQSLTVTCLP